MSKSLLSNSGPSLALPLGKMLWQLHLQYINVCIKPSVNTLREALEQASWWLVLVQFLSFVIIMVLLSFLASIIPSAALHGLTILSIGFIRPLGGLPILPNGTAFVLASFFIGLGTAYVCSKLCSGQGTFLGHCYCLQLCTVPLVIVGGALLLLPAPGWLLPMLAGMVLALFIYRMVLHTLTIMAVHNLGMGQSVLIVLILPIVILTILVIVWLFSNTHGDGLGDLCGDLCDVEYKGCRRKATNDSTMR